MKKKTLILNEFKSSKFKLNKIIEHPFLWWNSREILKLRKKFSALCCLKTKNDLNKWKDFFKSL